MTVPLCVGGERVRVPMRPRGCAACPCGCIGRTGGRGAETLATLAADSGRWLFAAALANPYSLFLASSISGDAAPSPSPPSPAACSTPYTPADPRRTPRHPPHTHPRRPHRHRAMHRPDHRHPRPHLCFGKLASALWAVFFRRVGSGFPAGCAVSAAACLRCFVVVLVIWLFGHEGVLAAVGAALESDESSVVDGAVDEGGGHVLVAQDASPSAGFDVGGRG